LRVAYPNPITGVWRTLLTKSVVELAQSDEAQFIGQEESKINTKVTIVFDLCPTLKAAAVSRTLHGQSGLTPPGMSKTNPENG
jgi:hypothetical protein